MTTKSASTREKLAALSQDRAQLLELVLRRRTAEALELKPQPRTVGGERFVFPASGTQQRIWFIHQLEGDIRAYHIPVGIRLVGALNVARLRDALNAVVDRHEILRTVFKEVSAELVQEVASRGEVPITEEVISVSTVAAQEAQVLKHAFEELARPFDLMSGPFIRGRLIKVASDEHVLVIVMHHLIADGWSAGVLVREIGALYGAMSGAQVAPVGALPVQYGDFVIWQRQRLTIHRVEEHLQYWKEQLQGAPELLHLPTDRPRPAVQSYRGDSTPVSFGRELTAELRAFSRRFNSTLAMVVHAAWSVVLARLSGQEDIVIGVPVANRPRVELEDLIGVFVNTLAVRVRMEDDPTVAELLERVKDTMLNAQAHQDAPFDKVVEMLQPVRTLSHSPLFQVMLTFQSTLSESLTADGVTLTQYQLPLQTAQFDLNLFLELSPSSVHGFLNYASDLFDVASIERYIEYLKRVLVMMVRSPTLRISALPLMGGDERRRMLDEFNATEKAYSPKLVHELFEEQVIRTPDAVAIVYEGQTTSYADLNSKANQLARYLIAKGVGPDECVALCIERSVEMVLGLLGVLKSGGAYLPVDPGYPPERLEYMLRSAMPRVLLTQEHLRGRLPVGVADIVALDSEWSEVAQLPAENIDRSALGLRPEHLAYVIYTSGSTGQPKGAMNEHRAVSNRLQWMQDQYRLGPDDGVMQKTPFSFDVSVWEFFWTLMSGARLVVARPSGHRDPQYLRSLIDSTAVTTLHFVPSMLQLFLDQYQQGSCASLRRIVCSGEELSVALQNKCLELLPKVRLANLYGPTEAAVDVTSWECERAPLSRVPIGRPIANIKMYLLDRRAEPVPVGVAAEIYIGGVGVGRGYLKRPELTAERFVPDPFSADPHARLYKTGDVGRWRADASIEYLGRNDHQVKIRGFRIELGEIEARLLDHKWIKESVVVAREDVKGDRRLVGYVVVREEGVLSSEQLRAYLKTSLPEYMVPNAIMILDKLPLTPNGKLDRRALPAPGLEEYVTRSYEAPQGEVEEILAGIWQDLLRVERVGRKDNFFELGGHSLLIVQMMERLRRQGLSSPLRRVFDSSSLAEQASALSETPAERFEVPPNLIPPEADTITPEMLTLVQLTSEQIEHIVRAVPGGASNVQDIYPLAPLQEGILFHHLLGGQKGDAYVVPTLLCVASRQRVDDLIAALQAVIDRHDALRTAVLWEGLSQPVQVVCRAAPLSVENRVLNSARRLAEQLDEWLAPEQQRLSLGQVPLMRLQVASSPNADSWYVLLQLHHISGDNTSQEMVTAEIVAHLEGTVLPPPSSAPYRNHVARAVAHARSYDSEAFFRGKLEDIVEPTAPFGLLDVHGDGAHIDEVQRTLDDALSQRVRANARRRAVSSATLFHAAWALVVAATSGRDDVVFGSVLLGRLNGDVGAQRTMGMFINTLPLRLSLQGVGVRELVERTQRELVELLVHEQMSLAVAQRCSGVAASVPLFTALLNYRHGGLEPPAQWSDARGFEVLAVRDRTNYPVTVSIDDLGENFRLTAQTDNRLDAHRFGDYLCTAIESLVWALENAPDMPSLALSILPESERRQIIDVFNATDSVSPGDTVIHELFEEQVQRTPHAVAVTHGGRGMTYSELNARANQLARFLRSLAVEQDEPVGICLERGVDMIVGLLGILKAGAAYLPLDPNYPRERLEHMLLDARPRVVLTQGNVRDVLPAGQAAIALDTKAALLAEFDTTNISAKELLLSPRNLVYVIYTSGSTGRPKGTAMSHAAMVNLIQWHRKQFGESAARVLQFAALSFDVAFQDTFSTLCTGGTLVLLDEWVRKDARALLELLDTEKVERIFVPPLLLQSLAECFESLGTAPTALRDVITAGEQLRISPEIIAFFKSLSNCRLHNHYGPTETHVVTALTLDGNPEDWPVLPTVGRPIDNTKIFILDAQQRPVPIGVAAEIYIGGANVARGYLNRPELTAQRFVGDPFGRGPLSRLYKTGDLGRWRHDGTLEFLGRNDDQVKIRGYRIELGEIEHLLSSHAGLSAARVIAREDVPGDRRLVAYVTAVGPQAPSVEDLREHLKGSLPNHMMPSAFVFLGSLPLTPSGKLNRRALPAPDSGAYGTREYEPPRSEAEEVLVTIWQDLLRIERVGRGDNFFELGGHSLLIVQLMERLRRHGLSTEVRSVFESQTLADLAETITSAAARHVDVPANLIVPGCTSISPEMLPLVQLESEHIDRIVQSVAGGAANIQDIYPLVPLQEGILFHHLMSAGRADTYVVPMLLSVSCRARLDELIAALQATIDRHDILRTAVLWEELPRPVQVVYRHVTLPVTEVLLAPESNLSEQVRDWIRPERQWMDIRRGPLMRLQVAADLNEEHWYVLLQLHHLAIDHVAIEAVTAEVVAHLQGRAQRLADAFPYRNHVAQSLAYARTHDAEAFFRRKLETIDEPTAPFGLMNVYGDGAQVKQCQLEIKETLAHRIRAQARRLGVTSATLFHAAWGMVVARTSGRDDVVFGSVLLGRLQGSAGAEYVLGLFINTLPLRLQLRGSTAREAVMQTQRELVELLNHEQASLAVAQRCSGIAGSAPLFTALLNYRHSVPNPEGEWASAEGVDLLAIQDRTNYPVTLSVDDLGVGFRLTTQTDPRIEPTRVTDYLDTAIQSLVEALESAPHTPILALSVIPERERHQIVHAFNAAQTPAASDGTIHQLFEQQVKRSPNAVAVEYEGRSLTYAELNRKSNQLAWYLRDAGACPDQLVALCADRSLDLIVGLLGILKSGAAYLPLDPNYTGERMRYMLEDALPRILVTQAKLRAKLPRTTAKQVALDDDWDTISRSRDDDLDPCSIGLRPDHLAYVIYTSGSTGKPKGVMVEHCNVTRLFTATAPWFAFNERDVWTMFHSFAFDFSVWELWGALFYGGRVVVVPYLIARSPQEFYSLICDRGVTVLNQTPSAFVQLIDAQARVPQKHSLRVVIFGGEALELHKLRPWIERNGADHPKLVNMYGITETSVHVTYSPLESEVIAGERASLIGRPIPDLKVYLLDRHGEPVPIGVAGEMYVGGAGVARGYLGRPDLTAQRFMANPFCRDPLARLYRSGDLAAWRADGTLEYLGRNDQQVKIRGFRVELGEVEAQLLQHAQVKEAVVIAREDAPGQKRLLAYVILHEAFEVVSNPPVESLREHMKAALPDYMVPSAFVVLDRLPLTSNGKLDRRALPAPELSAFTSREYSAPQGEFEEILAGIWQALLNVERVGRHENFFELGGHSLLIVQMMERLRRVGLSAEVRRVFDSPTLADLASELSSVVSVEFDVPPNRIPSGCTAIAPAMLSLIELDDPQLQHIAKSVPGGMANIQDIYPLAPLQEGILFHHLLGQEGGDIYVLPSVLSVSSRERLDALIAALQAVIDRHDVLRTAVLWEGLPQPVQVVYRRAVLPVEEVTLDARRTTAEQIEAWMKPERQRLDLQHAPLMRLQIAREPRSSEWYVLWQLHHIVDDATSLRVVMGEVMSHLEGSAGALPAAVPYRNHVAHALAYAKKHDAEAFFRDKLGDIDEPTASFGLVDVHGDGTHIEESHRDLDLALAQRARVQARRLGVSAATLFHAAWALVTAHTAGRDDVVFGTVLLGRLQGAADAQRTLGMFINTLPLRLRLRHVTAKGLVEQTQRELVQLLSHEQASLATAQRCSGVIGSLPLFTSLLNYRHNASSPSWPRESGIRSLVGQERTNYPVTLSVDDLGEGFRVTALTDRQIDPNRITAYLETGLDSLVGALENRPKSAALMLPVIPEKERKQLLREFNQTDVPYDVRRLVHELFEAQVQRTPNEFAVVHAQQSLTYLQLDQAANRLAWYLRSKGVAANGRVGVCAERSCEMVIAVLAALKAGAAYVPLDPTYPPERLEYMIRDAAPAVILTQERLRGTLPRTEAEIVPLDTTLPQLVGEQAENLPAVDRASDTQCVYIIYTSGSTGRPKGTAMSHSSMVNLIEWHRSAFPVRPAPRVLQFAALSFDVAFQEIFSTLCTGGTLTLLDEWMRRDVRALVELVSDGGIDRLFVPPLMLQSIAEYCVDTGHVPRSLSDVITAGEQLRISPEIVQLFDRIPDCRLHNHYGPTETHVVSALTLEGTPRMWPTFPTIGRPIANTELYVLDAQREPVPLGALGEIYIGGVSLARGYLNRPELTAAHFVSDPFRGNPHARLYKTGDLGRWLPDGTIEYIGRNDDQVKIRGFRIELAEIEAQLALHADVREAAVVVREDTPSNRRLVGYVVARMDRQPSADELRAYLRTALPEHMVPSAIVMLNTLPRTPSGKLNRRALPAPEIDAFSKEQYEPPQGEAEKTVASIWQDVLRIDRVGRRDNFFDLGGHSLLVLKSLLRVNKVLGCSLRVIDVYQNPTPLELAARIGGGLSGVDEFVDLTHEAQLDPKIIAATGDRRMAYEALMVTGATGFVGRFLLAQLLEDTDATIYCMLRARTPQQAAAHLRGTLLRWNLWRDEFESRLVAVPGDLRRPGLGIDEQSYRTLAENVDAVYHCATSMNHLETYAMAKAANVESAREMLELATCGRPKLINYLSTLGIFSPTGAAGRTVSEISQIDHEKHSIASGYASSKWVAEKIFSVASERGIPCNVFRLGLVWADAGEGRYDELQREYRIIKSCLLSGFGIRNYCYVTPPTPADFAARAVAVLARAHHGGHGVFHIPSSGQMSLGVFESCNKFLKVPLDLLPMYDWIREIKRLHRRGVSLPVVPLIEYAFSMSEADFYEHQRSVSAATISVDCQRTRQALEDVGIATPPFNDALLKACVTSMLERDEELKTKIM